MTPEQARLEIEALYNRHEHRMTAIERCALSSAIGAIYNVEKAHADLKQQLEDARVEALFWKTAADNAVDGWIKQEDVSIALRTSLVEVCKRGLMHVHRDSVSGLEFRRTIIAATADDAPEDT